MASKGRGPDSMLIHMAPSEVRGLQALAQAHGGSLTINPETGLPEAGFLDKLLPAILGFAITAATGIPAWQVGLGIGAVETARTGDLGKGITAGLGAYGGAGLGAGFATAGASQLAGEALLPAATEQAALEGVKLPADYAQMAARSVTPEQIAAAKDSASAMDLMSKGVERVSANPMDFANKDNFKYLGAAAAPILADEAVKSNLPTTVTKPGMIAPYSYDPYSGRYTAYPAYEAGTKSAADGGLMGMADGGYNPGQLDFAQHSEPVLRMAAGGSSYSTVREDGSVFDDLDQQNRDASREVIQEVPPRPITPDQTSPLIVPATPAPVQGTSITEAPPRPIAPDLTSPLIAPVTPAPVQGTSITGTTGGLDSLAAKQAATAGPAANTGLLANAINQAAAGSTTAANALSNAGVTAGAGVGTTAADTATNLEHFQTVYDPATGRSFFSPAQALQYGVKDYVTQLPMKIELLNSVLRDKVKSAMAGGQTIEQVFDALGKQYGMTGQELYNNEARGALNERGQAEMAKILQTGSGGLAPAELTAKLQAYKDKPPTTGQEFEDQQRLYGDYSNRYANSNWNYANMGGKAQDFSLKPPDFLALKFNGYAAPINFALSKIDQNSNQFKDVQKILTEQPYINTIIDQLYKINPESLEFASINPKYSGGTPESIMANNFISTTIKRLANSTEQYGPGVAMKHFFDEQKNLLSMSPDENGERGNFYQSTMANPTYVAIQRLQDSYTPVVSDDKWNQQSSLGVPKGSTFSDAYRDPDTGKGLALVYDKKGEVQGVRFIDQSGTGNTVYNDPAKLVEAAYQFNIPLSAFSELAKKLGTDTLVPKDSYEYYPGRSAYYPEGLKQGIKLSDLANGSLAKTVASDDWLNFMTKDAKDKDTNPNNPEYAGGLNDTFEKYKNQSKIAKDYLAALGGTPVTGNAASTTGATTGATTGTTGGLGALTAATGATTGTTGGLGALAATTGATAGSAVTDQYVANVKDALAKNPNANAAQIKAAMGQYNLSSDDVALAMKKAGASDMAIYAALNPGFQSNTSGTGLAGLNANIKNAAAAAARDKPDMSAAEIKTLLAKYGGTSEDFVRAMGVTPEQWDAAHGAPVTRVTTPTDITTAPDTTLLPGIGGNTGPSVIGGGTTVNPNGTITTSPRIPNIPVGGFTGMQSLRDAYTKGGGSLGYVPNAPKTMDEFNARYNTMTGGSKQAYDYLTGKSAYTATPYTPTGQIQKPYWESVGGIPEDITTKKYIFKGGKYIENPDFVPPDYTQLTKGASSDTTTTDTGDADLSNPLELPKANPGAGKEWVWNVANNKWEATAATAKKVSGKAAGGLTALAGGGMSAQYDLGGYSDGGRLLRGPGDGVSDSIPATIGNKRPARLADGEFVVPARIVSELGNGSTEAGARKLYAMMDRVQAARRGSIGKGKVAKNSRADKYLPA
jgi:hypothetical protein